MHKARHDFGGRVVSLACVPSQSGAAYPPAVRVGALGGHDDAPDRYRQNRLTVSSKSARSTGLAR
jgi:hypothetical protein